MVALDPLFRATRFNWCYCGSLQDLYDPEGNRTHWDYDISARLLGKTYADGKKFSYTYDLAGRLKTVTDSKSQVKTHSYFTDSQLKQITYTASQIATPNVSFTYDPVYGRLQTMTDGTGLTTYAFHPVDGTTLGAGNLHTIDGPLANDTVAHTYDALGRMKTQSINGVANTTTVNIYDALGRVESLTNPLGTFQHTYDSVNLLPKTVSAPNGLTTTFDYHTAAADLRLKEIKNQLSGNAPLSTHGYIYSPEGNIKSWSQTTDTNPAKTWGVAYDRADQLEAATLTNSSAVVQEHHAWRYDKIGNRTSRQNGPQITQTTHNNRNQITSEEPGGWMRVRGTTDEGASVRVKSNANPFTNAATTSANEFSAWVRASPGANSVTIEATDYTNPTPYTTSKGWSVNIIGQSRVPSYDLNGNTETNGSGHTYQWDAENRLVKITYADNSSTEFQYDGLSRRARITEKTASNTITSDKRYLWAGGNQPAEERDAAGSIVLKQYHPQGEFILAATAPLNKLFFSHDHLGSVRELVDANGTLQTRYDYDMWGKRVKLSGTPDSDVGYTGHHQHAKSGLILTWYRAYDAEAGRWLSADPLEMVTGEMAEMLPEGPNLYSYLGNSPMNGIDPLGLFNPTKCLSAIGNGANASRLYAAGMTKLAGAAGLTATGAGAPAGVGAAALGGWNLSSGMSAQTRGMQQWNEAFNESWSDASFKNLLGVLPFGTEMDDKCEPSPLDVLKNKVKDFTKKPLDFLREIGTFGF